MLPAPPPGNQLNQFELVHGLGAGGGAGRRADLGFGAAGGFFVIISIAGHYGGDVLGGDLGQELDLAAEVAVGAREQKEVVVEGQGGGGFRPHFL